MTMELVTYPELLHDWIICRWFSVWMLFGFHLSLHPQCGISVTMLPITVE